MFFSNSLVHSFKSRKIIVLLASPRLSITYFKWSVGWFNFSYLTFIMEFRLKTQRVIIDQLYDKSSVGIKAI